MMFGYACDETPELMPAPLLFAHRLVRRLSEVRKDGEIPWLRPDGKAQITMEYDGFTPKRVHTVVMSAQHEPCVVQATIERELRDMVIVPSLSGDLFDPDECIFHINPTGRFEIGGPHGDAGLTGRKIIVDTYGGMGHHGGGAFSGKDATKVDRSGAYAARWAAKKHRGRGDRGKVRNPDRLRHRRRGPRLHPCGHHGNGEDLRPGDRPSGGGRCSNFRPKAVIERLSLTRPIFRPTATYGHFGREPERRAVPDEPGGKLSLFTWEKTDRVADLRSALKL